MAVGGEAAATERSWRWTMLAVAIAASFLPLFSRKISIPSLIR